MGIEWKCDKCGGSFWIPVDDDNQVNVRRCECYPKYMFMQNINASGIGRAFQNKTFDNFKTENPALEQIKNVVMQYAEGYSEMMDTSNNSLLILGSVGTGKTHLAVATAVQIVNRGMRVKYVGYRDEIIALKQSILDREEYKRRNEALKTVPCLLIDDLFKGKITETDIGYFYDIINYRYLEQLPIIVTSEKSTKELMDIDEAVASRMFEMARNHIITIGSVGNYRIKSK